jgi:hypothetical protein
MKIVIYCSHSAEEWSPKSIDGGIGGSEEMTIYIAKELSTRGHEVSVYNRCGDDEGTYDGVTYKNYEDYPEKISCDVLIVWRSPELWQKVSHTKAKKKYLWLHDTIGESQVLPYIYLYDKIMVLSDFHRSLYPNIPSERIFMHRNAVKLDDFNQEVERDPYTVVYGSSYDRGLKELLESWSEIKIRVPEAKLRVFYGWETWDAQLKDNKNAQLFKDYTEHLFKQDGVTHLGRISHKEVAKEFLGAGIWAYPTAYPEVSCITAMKAQIGGAVPVVIPTAAVCETVLLGHKTPTDPSQFIGREIDKVHLTIWQAMMVEYLRDVKAQEAIRKVMQPLSRAVYSYEGLADLWLKEFEK